MKRIKEMRILTSISIVFLILFGSLMPAFADYNKVGLYLDNVPSVVQIVIYVPEKEDGTEAIFHPLGTGVVVSSDGYILTVKHILMEADGYKVYVKTYTGSTFQAQEFILDPDEDMALIKIEEDNLTPVRFNLARFAMQGEDIIIMSYVLSSIAFHPWPSVYSGAIAGTKVVIPGEAPITDLLQLDAFVAPGSSGGPIISKEGYVLGLAALVSIHYSDEDAQYKIHFGIPIQKAERLLKGIKR